MQQELLDYLNLAINAKKSCGLRIGPRNKKNCVPISAISNISIPGWVKLGRYFGVYITLLDLSYLNALWNML